MWFWTIFSLGAPVCCCIVWPSFLFDCFVKICATCKNFLGKWFTAPLRRKLPVRLCLSPFFSYYLEKMAQFLFPGWLIISYFLLWKKEGIDIPGWENDFLVKILPGKSLKVKILAGYCILTSTSSWLWGADIIFLQKLLINQKTLSDCQNITGGDIQSLSNFFSLSILRITQRNCKLYNAVSRSLHDGFARHQALCALRSLSIMGGIQNLIISLKMAWSEHLDRGVNIR